VLTVGHPVSTYDYDFLIGAVPVGNSSMRSNAAAADHTRPPLNMPRPSRMSRLSSSGSSEPVSGRPLVRLGPRPNLYDGR
jgi:hypothetical protein